VRLCIITSALAAHVSPRLPVSCLLPTLVYKDLYQVSLASGVVVSLQSTFTRKELYSTESSICLLGSVYDSASTASSQVYLSLLTASSSSLQTKRSRVTPKADQCLYYQSPVPIRYAKYMRVVDYPTVLLQGSNYRPSFTICHT
jgi:hypothetical protein